MTTKLTQRAFSLRAQGDPRIASRPVVHQGSRRQAAIARTAVQFTREDAGQYMTPQEIARYATALVAAGHAARNALAYRKSPKAHYAAARTVLQEFGAELVERGDVNGMVLGVRFASGRYTSGSESVFYVA